MVLKSFPVDGDVGIKNRTDLGGEIANDVVAGELLQFTFHRQWNHRPQFRRLRITGQPLI